LCAYASDNAVNIAIGHLHERNTGFHNGTSGAISELIVAKVSMFGLSNENETSVLSSNSLTSNFKSFHSHASLISNHETGKVTPGHHCG
jgi:hypothetical protein